MITTTMQKAPIPLTEDEYFYLSERFEPLTAAELEQGVIPKFLVTQKTETLRRLVRYALETELSDEERCVAELLFIGDNSVSETARLCKLSRQRVYTLSEAAKRKLQASLRYPFLLDFSLLHPPKSFQETLKFYGGNA